MRLPRLASGPGVVLLGLVGMGIGAAPLLVVDAWQRAHGDPAPNPIGCGCFAMFTFWPSLALALAGVVMTATQWWQRRDDDRRTPPPAA